MPISTCVVSGNVKTFLNANVEGCTIKVYALAPFFHTGSLISGEIVSTTTAANGNWSLTLIETETVGRRLTFQFEYYDGISGTRQVKYSVVVPDDATADFDDLVSSQTTVIPTPAFAASYVTVNPTGNLASTNAQAALEELQGDIDTINTLADGKIYVGNGSNVATEVTPSGDVTMTNAGVTAIASGVIVNADVSATAAIARSKLADGTASHVVINSGAGVLSSEAQLATSRGGTGQDFSASTGLVKVAAGTASTATLVNADVSASAAIARSKTATGTNYRILANDSSGVMSENAAITASRAVASDANGQLVAATTTATELGYVNGVTSAIQTQLDAKVAKTLTSTTGDMIYASSANTPARLGIGSEGFVITSTSGVPAWAAVPSAPTYPGELYNLGLSASVGSSALTVALKQADGSTDPASGSGAVKIAFRNTTAATGSHTEVSVTGSLSLVVSSGSTLGTASATAHYLYVYAINNAGTAELAISQTLYPDFSIVSTTAEGGAGAADSNRVIYSTTARSNVGMRLLGRLTSTQATAGTWATAIAEVALAGVNVGYRTSILARAHSSSTSITNGATTTAIFGTKAFDTHNAYSTSTGLFTCPVAGYYRVSSFYEGSGATGIASVNSRVLLRIIQNGSSDVYLGSWRDEQTGIGTTKTVFGSAVVSCAAGDTLGVSINNEDSTFSGANSSGATWVSFELVGASN